MDGDTRGLGERVGDDAGHLPRRLLVLGGAAAGVALLVGRGLRLDLPQPPPPVPTRRPAPDEALLLSVVADLEGIVADETSVLSAGGGDALVRRLRTLHREQLRVLRGRLTNAGVPTSVIAAAVTRGPSTSTATPTSTSTATPTSTPAPNAAAPVRTRSGLAARLDALGPDDWTRLTTATVDTRELVAAAYAQRLAGAVLLGRDVPLPSPSPARAGIVARTQPLVYAFEVVAAQSTGARRRVAEDTLAELVQLEVGVSGTSSTSPAGWALPFPVTTPDAARRLATEVLSSAVDAGTELAGARPTATALEDVARWSAHVQALAVDWDVPLTAFPGATT